MNPRFFLHLHRRNRAGIAAAFAAVLALLSPAVRAFAGDTSLAGISYDATAPLEASLVPKYDTAKPPAVLNWDLTFKGANGQTVPAYYMAPSAPGPKPAIIILHGLGGKKEDLKQGAAIFASRGFCVVAIDAAGHGARPMIDGKPTSQLDVEGMHKLCGQTVLDLRRTVDWLQTRPEVDKDRIGYLGVSMGGILGGVFAGNEPRLKAAVLWAAGGDWGKLVTTTTHPFAVAMRKQGKETDAGAVEAVMSDVDPVTSIAQFSPRPLLFINGDKDTVVPSACSEALFAAAKDPKERLILPGGHIPDAITMLFKSLDWLSKKLATDQTPKPAVQ